MFSAASATVCSVVAGHTAQAPQDRPCSSCTQVGRFCMISCEACPLYCRGCVHWSGSDTVKEGRWFSWYDACVRQDRVMSAKSCSMSVTAFLSVACLLILLSCCDAPKEAGTCSSWSFFSNSGNLARIHTRPSKAWTQRRTMLPVFVHSVSPCLVAGDIVGIRKPENRRPESPCTPQGACRLDEPGQTPIHAQDLRPSEELDGSVGSQDRNFTNANVPKPTASQDSDVQTNVHGSVRQAIQLATGARVQQLLRLSKQGHGCVPSLLHFVAGTPSSKLLAGKAWCTSTSRKLRMTKQQLKPWPCTARCCAIGSPARTCGSSQSASVEGHFGSPQSKVCYFAGVSQTGMGPHSDA